MSRSPHKKGPIGSRKRALGKATSEKSLAFGELVELPGGLPASRKFTRVYVPEAGDSEGLPLPRGSLYDR